ncbi:MAG: COX15/CtaA family protein [Actinobacteria bacterium]|nr:COX15/CtaA family protein [Actinomycetota bacterium]
MSRLQKLASWTFGITVLLVAIGGFTRGSESGYGCEDRWPLCENGLLGGLLPRPEFHMVVEWTHRWFASIAVVMVLATTVYAWWRHRDATRVTWSATAALVAILLQAGIGAFVVMTDLNADLVSVHLGVAMILLGLLTFGVVEAGAIEHRTARRATVGDPWPLRLAGGAAGVYLVIVLGSLVHDQYVGGYPLVGGELIPDLSNRVVALHFGHRVAVLLVGLALVWLAAEVVRRGRPAVEVRLVHSGLALFLVNVVLGAAHVFTRVQSTGLVVAHLLIASLAWSSLVGAAALARHTDRADVADDEPARRMASEVRP